MIMVSRNQQVVVVVVVFLRTVVKRITMNQPVMCSADLGLKAISHGEERAT